MLPDMILGSDLKHFVSSTKFHALRSVCFVPTLTSRHIGAPKEDSESVGIMIAQRLRVKASRLPYIYYVNNELRRSDNQSIYPKMNAMLESDLTRCIADIQRDSMAKFA